jgi:hypothetical protein
MALLLLGGCSTANHVPEVQLPDFLKGNLLSTTEARTPTPAAPATPGTPAYVMLASPNGSNGQPIAQVHMTLPLKMEMQPVRPGPNPTQGPFGPVRDVPPSHVAAANQPALSVLNSTAKQPLALVQPTSTLPPPPPTPPEGSTPILASLQDPPPGETIDQDLNRGRPDNRPTLSDILGKTSQAPNLRLASSAPAPTHPANEPARPIGNEVVTAPQNPHGGAALSGIVEEDPPSALPRPNWPTETSVGAESSQASAGPEIRLVNSKRISLNYEVKDAGQAGPTDVELWCSKDGRNWKKKETLPQGRPPCLVDVEDEDLYGFTLLVHRGGSPGKAPQEGDRPQVWVEVDVTKPTVWLLGVEAGRGPAGRQVTIWWKAADKNISSRPITLSFAPKPEGPWLPFASQLENTGRYVWQVPRDVPPHFLVRVEAIDQAGNVGLVQTPQALGEDPEQPTAAILKVEGASR